MEVTSVTDIVSTVAPLHNVSHKKNKYLNENFIELGK